MKTKTDKPKDETKRVPVCAVTRDGFHRKKPNVGPVKMRIPVCAALEKKAS